MGEPQPSTSALPTDSKPPLECSSSRASNRNLFPRDFTLILKGGEKVPVSSEVLCLNSSVFTKIIRDLKLTNHEMDDFEYDAVECFIQCLYTRKSKSLKVTNFRELYKIANVFDVSWLISKCIEFFEKQAKKGCNGSNNLHFLISEAGYAFETRKDSRLIDLLKRLSSEIVFPTESIYQILPSNKDLNDISSGSLELLKLVAGSEVEILARLVEKCVSESKSMTEKVKFLLDPVLLARCLIRDSGTYFSLFETMQNLETLTLEDMKFISKIQLECTRRVSQIVIDMPRTAVDSKLPDPICCRPNYYFSQKLKELNSYSEFMTLFRVTSAVKNLYMFIDGLISWMHFHANSKELPNWSKDIGNEIITLRIQRRWGKISEDYLTNKKFKGKTINIFFSSMRNCPDLVCKKKSSLIAEGFVSVVQLFKHPQVIKFAVPGQTSLEGEASSSTLLIKSTPLNQDCPSLSPDILFEFFPTENSDFNSVSTSDETIYPHQMHLSFFIHGNTKRGYKYQGYTPMPPFTWASGLRCCYDEGKFYVQWREIYFKKKEIPAADKNFEGKLKLKCKLYY